MSASLKNRDPREFRNHLLEECHVPNGEFGIVVGDSREVSPRPLKCSRGANGDRIGDKGKHDRDRRGRFSRRVCWRTAVADNDVYALADQFSGEARQAVELSFSSTHLIKDIGSFDIAELRQTRAKRFGFRAGVVTVKEHANPVNFAGLLCVQRAPGQG